MKTVIFAFLMLFTIPAFSANYACIVGNKETINFNAKIENNNVSLTFKKSTYENIGDDLNRKTASLSLDRERSEESGWRTYTGKLLVNKRYADYRHFEFRLSPSSVNGNSQLKGRFALSPRGISEWPSYLSIYSLECDLIK